jgi:release factor glutamine methyltransferase
MQISANTVSAVSAFYKKELAHIYTESELQNIIRWILEKQLNYTGNIHAEVRVNESDLIPLSKMCAELKANKPIQYILGEAEFFRLKFKVDESVLIPRPETEELVERVINTITSQFSHLNSHISIMDIGTGSGCIPVSIKKNIPSAKVYALDISDAALETAKYNAKQNGVDVQFFKTDILNSNAESILQHTNGEKLDVIISNPPYVLNSEKETLHQRVSAYEPHLALFVDDTDPIIFYRKIAALAQELLKKGGKLFFECHADYTFSVQQMLLSQGFVDVRMHADMSGLARLSEASKV